MALGTAEISCVEAIYTREVVRGRGTTWVQSSGWSRGKYVSCIISHFFACKVDGNCKAPCLSNIISRKTAKTL